MKIKYLLFKLLIILAFTATKTFAQAPQQFNYQGAARNANGTPLSNRQISLRISILDGSATGSAQYVETRTVTTNQLGLYNFAIGSAGALSTSGTIAGVKWADGLKYIKVEIDPNNGSAFTLAGTAQLLSVPYALYAGNSSGSAASTILNGNGAPSTTTGKDGDFYIDNVANMIFGPKASGSWPAGKNIVGPKGDKGDAGVDGAKGDTGIKGDKGDKGDAGQGGVTNAGSDIDVSGTGVVADPYIISSKITGANGLTKTGSNIELGGSVTKNTTLAIDAGKTLAITGLTTGTGGENILVVDGTTGVLKSVANTALVSAENGVKRDATSGKIELGGSLTKPTTITADNTNTLAVKGLQTGATTDSVMVVNPSTGIVSRVAPVAGANGLTKTGNNIELGGSVTKNTTLAIDAGKTLAITGLTTGGSSDNLVVVDGSGVVKSVAQSSLVSAANGVNKDAITGNIELGGSLTKPTTITADNTNTLAVKGLQTGATTDSVMVVNPSTGIVSRVAPVAGANGLTKTGNNIELGGLVTKNTTLAIDAGKTLAITGLTTGGSSDNLVVVDGSGVVKSVAQSSLVSAANGVNKDAITGNIELGGSLTKPTTITADNTNTLAVKGLQTGATTDSVMVVNPSTGIVSRVAPVAGANGLTKTGNNIELGGSVTKNTTLAIDAGKTLAITGLTTGGSSDNLVVVDGSGVVKSVAQSSLVSAANGVNKDAITGNIELGGSLTKPTTITADNTNTLAVKGLQTGATTDSVMVVNPSTGIVSRVAPVAGANGLTKTGNNIELGGLVTKNTTLAIDAGKTLAITGLTTGGSSDNLVVVDGSGVVKSVAQSSLVSAANGVNKDAITGNIELGGSLTKPTTITADNTNTLAVKGLQTGATTDSVMVVNPSTGIVSRVAPVAGANGLTKTGNNIELGGLVTKNTTLAIDAGKTLAITGLTTGGSSDNLVVVDGSGVVKSVAQSSLVSAANGVNKDAITGNIELGGSLTKPTTITADNTNTLAVKGLQTGATTDSVMVVNPSTGIVSRVAPVAGANGLTKTGDNIELGGSLTKPTTITADNTNTLAITGLQSGNTNDKVVVVDGTTGVVKSVAQTSLVSGVNAVNGVNKDAITGNIELGGALTKATTITSTPANTLAVKGLQTGSTADSVMVVNTSGVLRLINPSSIATAENGVTKDAVTGKIELGGALTKNTTLAIDAGKTLAITGLTTGSGGENILVVDGTTGVLKSVANTALVSAENGVTKDATSGKIELGGALTKATSITTDNTNTLAVKGLQTGATTDSVMVVNPSGVLRLINPSSIATAENGVTKDAVTGKIELGGALTKATTITSTPANTLAVKGLQTGSTADSVMVVNTSGVLRLINPSSIATAENGVTKDAVTGKIELGGSLTKATTITSTPANTLAVKGLQTGSTADSVMVVNTSGVLRLINPSSIATAENGVTKDAVTGKIELGGSLTKATTITSTPANTLAVKGLQTGSTTDSVMVVNPSTGIVSRVAPVAGANGLTKTGNNIELGGSLTKATAIQTTSSNTLALTGLQTGLSTENILVVNGSGVVKSLAPSTANNGLTRTGNNFQLGGALTGPTAITTDAAKTLAITGLQTGSGLENIMVVDGSGVVKSLAPSTVTANSWSLSGNAATNPATQFLGTTDAQPLVLRANNVEQMRINTAGNVGIGTTTPNTKLEVSSGSAGNSGFRLTNLTSALTTSTPNAATLGVNATGDLVVMSTAVSSAARNIINMPSVAIDISAAGNFTLDLYNAYKTQYNTPLVVSTGAPAAIPTIAAATDFYYYVTYYDTNVFSNVSINAAGVLSYTVTTNAVSSATFMNIVLVPKN